jgi:hypothetical protein
MERKSPDGSQRASRRAQHSQHFSQARATPVIKSVSRGGPTGLVAALLHAELLPDLVAVCDVHLQHLL